MVSKKNNIQVLQWPAQSSDLNHIEHLWDNLQRRVLEDLNNIQCVDQLYARLTHHWLNIPQNEISNLIS